MIQQKMIRCWKLMMIMKSSKIHGRKPQMRQTKVPTDVVKDMHSSAVKTPRFLYWTKMEQATMSRIKVHACGSTAKRTTAWRPAKRTPLLTTSAKNSLPASSTAVTLRCIWNASEVKNISLTLITRTMTIKTRKKKN